LPEPERVQLCELREWVKAGELSGLLLLLLLVGEWLGLKLRHDGLEDGFLEALNQAAQALPEFTRRVRAVGAGKIFGSESEVWGGLVVFCAGPGERDVRSATKQPGQEARETESAEA